MQQSEQLYKILSQNKCDVTDEDSTDECCLEICCLMPFHGWKK